MIQKEVFSELLKAAMKKQNLKQIDLVRAAQVQGIKLGKSHVSQYVSGKTVPRTDILLFLAKTLQVEEEWLIGVSNVESDTEISASNRNILDTNKTILGNSNKENSEALTMSAKRQKSSIFVVDNITKRLIIGIVVLGFCLRGFLRIGSIVENGRKENRDRPQLTYCHFRLLSPGRRNWRSTSA